MLGNIMTGFLIILVGVVTAPVVANSVQNALLSNNNTTTQVPNTNYTNGTTSIMGLITLFYVLAVAVAAMDIAVVGLRQSGLIV